MCSYVANEHDRLDILIHCAGTMDHGKLADSTPESFDRLYHANVRGPLMLTQRLLPLLKKPRGQVVFMNSSVGLNARGNKGHYSATKHALKALADSLREEVNADGVRISSVFPGRTATPLMRTVCEKECRPFQPELLLQPEDVANVVVNALTFPWTAEVTNISIRPCSLISVRTCRTGRRPPVRAGRRYQILTEPPPLLGKLCFAEPYRYPARSAHPRSHVRPTRRRAGVVHVLAPTFPATTSAA